MTFKIWRDESVVSAKSGLAKSNITYLPNGGYVVSWTDSLEGRIYLQRYDGAGQMDGARVAVDTAGNKQYDSEIQAYGSDGDFVVSWQESAGANEWSVKSRVFKADGTVQQTQTLATKQSLSDWDRPAVANKVDGGFVTAYPTSSGIQLSVHNEDGIILAAKSVGVVSTAKYVDVAAIGDDQFVVSYSISNKQYYRVMSLSGTSLTEVDLKATGMRSDVVALKNDAGIPTGNFVVIYNDGSTIRAKFDTISDTGVQITSQGLNQDDFVGATALRGGRVAVIFSEKVPRPNPNGRDDLGDIFVQIINADGTLPLGGKILINDLKLEEFSQQKAPAISEMADGRLAITWHDPTKGGSTIMTSIVDPRIAPVTVEGTERADIYYGSEHGVDSLYGFGGNDKLYGDAGDDILNGGADADLLNGGSGNDIADYFGSAGLAASLGGDFVNTGDAAGDKYESIERLHGTGSDDVLGGNAGKNYIFGFEGNDWLYGGAGAVGDTLDGGGGFNSVTFEYSEAGVGITLDLLENKSTGEAKDDVFININAFSGSNYADTLIGWNKYNEFRGLKGDDSLIGGSAHDYLDGGDGSDTLQGGGGADDFVGGAGTDFASYQNTTTGVTVSLVNSSQTNPSPNTEEAVGDTYNGIEGLISGSGNDILIGNNLDNILEGRAGADTLQGGDGNDTVSYAGSNAGVVVNLAAKSGSGGHAQGITKGDTYVSIENAIGSNFNDTLIGDAKANVLNGGGGIDTVDYSAAGGAVKVDLATGSGSGSEAQDDTYAEVENVIGSQFGDTLIGNGAANVLQGGNGDDVYYVSAGDVIIEGANAGNDKVFTDTHYTLGANLQDLEGTGGAALMLTGNELNNRITGNAAGNWIDGGVGADTMMGGAGDDVYVVDNVGDVVEDYLGNNTVVTSVQLDPNNLRGSFNITVADGFTFNVQGTNGNNVLKGNAVANTLKGNGGNDMIYGMLGNDKLYGGTGRDTFVFDTRLNKTKNVDKIYDFKSKDDTFHLDNAIFTKLGSGTAARPKKFKSDMFVEGKRAQDREDRIVYDKKTGALYYDKDGTGGSVQVKIATINNKTTLKFDDFFVI
ncbi:hypothetical protein VB618_16795 [Microvirga sp. CF3062]|uniref:hypothetical protein n=1 Tax=Microvirga sp. CF3062 TaxID=3110182 RepID=UPI002E7793AE|nr:hypothetical protein [Microvirga sp. CF3062]MEE1657860.1 hypothetical protein [Microvirga sp. CF3062]